MTEIRLDQQQIERIIAQVLRDQYKMMPAIANEAARTIGTRLLSSLPMPGATRLNGAKLIYRHSDSDFRDAFQRAIKQGASYEDIWDLVYQHAAEVPAVVADAINY